ncbi:putative lipid II flippase FtsW [bacterium]|nr:putative lipid II flippase FtsW [bacterium]
MLLRGKYNLYYRLCISSGLLIVLGSVFVLSSSLAYGISKTGNPAYFFEKHLLWLSLGGIGVFLINKIGSERIEKYAKIIFLFSLILLPLPKFFGSLRWIRVGPLSFQPSELIKFTFIIYLSDFLKRKKSSIQNWKTLSIPVFLLLIITGILQLQSDLGTFVIISLIFVFLLFIAGAKIKHLIFLFLAGIFLLAGLILPSGYRRERIKVYLNPNYDPLGKGYQINQSKITLGSGGIFGKGLGAGERKLKFLPEAHKDYVYAVVGEELGFVGTFSILLFFGIVVFSGFEVSKLAYNLFDKYLSAGLSTLFGFQFLLHSAVVLGIVPSKGTTLPFFSVGGSSLIINLLALGLLLHIARKECFRSEIEDFQQFSFDF